MDSPGVDGGMRILLTGATGYVGSRLVTSLRSAGHHITVTSRDPDRTARYGWFHDVTAVTMDAHDASSVTAAFAAAGPIDVIYYLLHGIGEQGFREADARAAANVARAARGVDRIVYLGGFVPDADNLSEHLAGRAEVAEALYVDGGPEVIWLGAAMIIGAGSTSFEIMRYVSDRLPVLPLPSWASNPIDPISIQDVLHYLVAAADPALVPAGAYDICGPETTTYHDLLSTYARLSDQRQVEIPVGGVPTSLVSRVSDAVLPLPDGLTADLTASLDYPMKAGPRTLRELVPDPDGGLVTIAEAMQRSLQTPVDRAAVDKLADPHHLADTDPDWAGGDDARIRHFSPLVADALGPLPGAAKAAVRTTIDVVTEVASKLDPR